MSYEATTRSNYFMVKDKQAFLDAIEHVGVVILDTDSDGRISITSSGHEEGGWPTTMMLPGETDDTDVDVPQLVAEHLMQGEIAVFLESGNEKKRYVGGHATAVNHEGEEVFLNLSDIYEMAKQKFGVDPQTV